MKTKTLLALSTALITSLGVNEGEASRLFRKAEKFIQNQTPITAIHIEHAARFGYIVTDADISASNARVAFRLDLDLAPQAFANAQVENPTREQIEGWARINGPYQTLHRRLFEIGLPLADFTEDYRTAYTAFSAGGAPITRNKLQTWVAIEGRHQAAYRGLFAHGIPLGDITDDYRAAYGALSEGEGEMTYDRLRAWANMPDNKDRVDNRTLIAMGSPSGGMYLEGYRILRKSGGPLSAQAIEMWVEFMAAGDSD